MKPFAATLGLVTKQFLFRAAFGLCLFSATCQASQIGVYLSAPASQSSTVTFANGVTSTTETFNSANGRYSSYSSAIGTYSGNILVQAADQFGGANGSNYMVFGSQSGTSTPVTLTLKTAANYFGFWWSAGDVNNGITLYSAGTKLAHLSTADITTLLSGPKVTAINGQQYNSSQYYCNPNNTSQDCSEPFAYVNLIASAGVTFDTIVFDNNNTTGTGFESDNQTVANGTAILPNTSVVVENLVTATPEPGSFLLLASGLGTLLLGIARRKPLR